MYLCVFVCRSGWKCVGEGRGKAGVGGGTTMGLIGAEGGEVCFRQVMGCGIGLEKGKGRGWLDRFAETDFG